MAFSDPPIPTDYFPGYVFMTSAGDGSATASTFANSTKYICIPTSILDSSGSAISDAHANAATGDGREVVYELVHNINEEQAAEAAADKPTSPTVSISNLSGASATTARQSYTFQFLLNAGTLTLVDEA